MTDDGIVTKIDMTETILYLKQENENLKQTINDFEIKSKKDMDELRERLGKLEERLDISSRGVFDRIVLSDKCTMKLSNLINYGGL